MRRLLVTGGTGFIGTNFVHYWYARHPDDAIVVLDALTYAGNPANLDALRPRLNFRFVKGDICDRILVEHLFASEAIDTVVHFAAESHVDRSIDDPDAFIKTNVLGTHTLLQAARAFWLGASKPEMRAAHRFHHVSTDEVYGSLDSDTPLLTEDSPLRPNSPYAASKAASDLLVRSYHRTYGLQVTTSNSSNNYGPFQFPEKLVALTIVSILQGQQVPIYGDGMQVRDWLYVLDHCRALERVLDFGRPGTIYNIGGWTSRTNLEVVSALCEMVDAAFVEQPSLRGRFPNAPPALGKPSLSLLTHIGDRPGHDRRYALASERIIPELRFEPQYIFEEWLHRTVSWYLENEAWWRRILQHYRYREWMAVNYLSRGNSFTASRSLDGSPSRGDLQCLGADRK
jgi:dTDP-glucose 4,6-dehydratase